MCVEDIACNISVVFFETQCKSNRYKMPGVGGGSFI